MCIICKERQKAQGYKIGNLFHKGNLQKKNSKKSDIVTIRSWTYLLYLISDIEISDICLKNVYLPTLMK